MAHTITGWNKLHILNILRKGCPLDCACELTVFVCGAAVMIFELAGSRILAPYAGTSLRVWTNLIGVILASLSVGYWCGGKLADRRPYAQLLSLMIFLAAVCVGLTALLKDTLLSLLNVWVSGHGTLALCASLVLFAPANVFLGMVSPYAARLKIRDVGSSGSTVGRLYALSAIGSITGTFLAGFVLIPAFGIGKLLLLTSAVLGLVSLAAFGGRRPKTRVVMLFLLLAVGHFTRGDGLKEALLDIDTPYNRVWIYRDTDEETGRPILALATDPYGQESAMYLDGDDLVFDYMKYFRLAEQFSPRLKRALMIGGAAYSYPKDFLRRYPEASIDVVEIDPTLTEISRKYFNLQDNPRLAVFHEDGRTYFNRRRARYDAIIIDAFRDANCLPYQLTTVEAVRRMRNMLVEGGVALVNIIGSIEGVNGRFTRAECATYAKVFPRVMLFPVDDPKNARVVQNIILVALNSDREPRLESADVEMNRMLRHLWGNEVVADVPVLTDDRAPVEYYLAGAR
ncbi:MAG: fused MFS/spermidine synthase [Candidatus Aureabacteria bacterium]|nr:fused MFS/spermidine synthase [Candidatus Auribacterota bacterium]